MTVVEFRGFPDGVVEYGIALRSAVAEVIRRHRLQIVITSNFRDTLDGQSLNQADHIATGRAVVDAVRDAGNRWVFSDQLTDGLQLWNGVRAVWASSSPQSNRAVDSASSFDAGVASLEAHRAYIAGFG